MVSTETVRQQLDHTLQSTDFSDLGEIYRGKVRDVYKTPERLVIITTDRVSAFDRVLGTIPFKGQILNRIAQDAFAATADIIPNHVISIPDPNVLVAKPVNAYPVEFIVRRYITGSLWRDYGSGKASAYGIDFPQDLKADQRFEKPILTPSTKAELGAHDEPISEADIVRQGLMTQSELDEAAKAAFALFERGTELAAERGLILVDTKYELGKDADGNLMVIDEIHTPDSSRYWVAESYEERFQAGKPQAMLDKENLRQWLIETHDFKGEGTAPALDEEIRTTLSMRYLELYKRLNGHDFEPATGDPHARLRANLEAAGLVLTA